MTLHSIYWRGLAGDDIFAVALDYLAIFIKSEQYMCKHENKP